MLLLATVLFGMLTAHSTGRQAAKTVAAVRSADLFQPPHLAVICDTMSVEANRFGAATLDLLLCDRAGDDRTG